MSFKYSANKEPGGPRSVREILDSGTTTRYLIKHTSSVKQLQDKLSTLMPELTGGGLYITRFKSGHLYLMVNDPAMATVLRFRQEEILAACEQVTGKPATRLRIRLHPAS